MERKTKLNIPMLLMVVLLALNMRANYTGVGTIINLIKTDLGMTNAVAGMVTTVPLIVFAIVCPISPRFAQKYGIGRMIQFALVLITIGCVTRSFADAFGLFAGTIILMVGIGIMNALMVGLIKLRFERHSGLMTGIYTTTMALSTGLCMGYSVRICDWIGWRGCLAVWAVFSLLALVLWSPQAGKQINAGNSNKNESVPMGKLVRNIKVWQLTLYMGSQSMLFYCISAWLPTILQTKGLSATQAATSTMILQMVSLSSSLLIPIIAEKMNRVLLALIFGVIYLIGALSFYFSSPGALMWFAICCLALGCGTGFSFCIYLFSKRARNAAEASAISGFSQCGGYVLAAIGPVLMGRVFDVTGTWDYPMMFCFVIMIIMTVASLLATRTGYLLDE